MDGYNLLFVSCIPPFFLNVKRMTGRKVTALLDFQEKRIKESESCRKRLLIKSFSAHFGQNGRVSDERKIEQPVQNAS